MLLAAYSSTTLTNFSACEVYTTQARLLHKAAGYTPDTRSFHMETGAKRGLLVRALVRLLTSAAARHKALLSAKPHVFESTILTVLTHMEETLIGTLPKEQQWSEGSILSAEVLALVSGGASSASLQELSSTSVVHWMTSQTHPSPGLLFPLVVTASRTILHLNHRNPIIQAGLTALFTYADWCGWEGEITWPTVISSLSFPLTNPNAMLSLAAQDGHLLVVYAYVRWQRQQTVRRGDASLLSSLLEMIEAFIPNATLELGLVLLLSEILDLTTYLVTHSRPVESIWLHSSTLASRLAVWAEDRSSSGILAAIGLGRQSPLSPGVRLICRCISTFLNTQMPRKGIFRTHPLHLHSDVDGSQGDSANGAACTLEQLRVLSTNTTYAALTHPLNEAIQFIEEPAHCLGDVHTLLAKLVSDILPDPLLRHLTVQFDIPEPSAPSPSILPQDFQMCLPKPDVDLGPEST
ncbi:hypothetical protein SK128_026802 [Halocaridina rubra]|uniref:Uncharacterized protein n=1 Tax=Halocaridina rubra TaxID=373956 RepID=A0AAN8XR61_HALRR